MTTTLPCWPPSSSSSSSVFPRREEDDAKWARRVFVLIKIFFLSDSSERTAQKKVAIKNEMKTADVARWLKTTLLVMISNQRRMMFHFAIVGLTVQRSNSNFKMLESKKKFSLLRKAIRNEWKMMDLFIFSLSTSPIHTPVGWIQISSFYFSSLSRELSRVHNKTAPELLETKKKIKKTTQRIQKRWRRDTKKKSESKVPRFCPLNPYSSSRAALWLNRVAPALLALLCELDITFGESKFQFHCKLFCVCKSFFLSLGRAWLGDF